MTIPTGLSAKQVANYRQEAAKTIARFDDNRDGQIDRTEADRQRFSHRDSYSFTNRISDNYVSRTTVTQEHSNAVKAGAFERVDANRDGRISSEEMTETYLNEQDNNKDGKLGFWEKATMGISGMVDMVQRRITVEVDRTTRMEYDPLPPRPTPPIPYPNDRPTPPSPGGRPTPPRPDSDRPSPPSPGGSSRPTPPSTGGDRPTPPRP